MAARAAAEIAGSCFGLPLQFSCLSESFPRLWSCKGGGCSPAAGVDNGGLATLIPPERLPPACVAVLDLATITAPFYPRLAELGEFEALAAEDMPANYQTLLAHDDHMTVTVEAFHRSLVDVRVLDEHRDGDLYSRASLLARQTDGRVVQLGVMRVNLASLPPAVRVEIEAGRMPLGRILIRHNVMRHVRLFQLWRITPGEQLRRHLGAREAMHADPAFLYGRTAGIVVDGRLCAELLEIVTT